MKILRQFQNLFRRRTLDAEMAEEMRLHLELQAERHRATGLNAVDAAHAAQRDFGNLASLQEQVREVWAVAALEPALRDLRLATRSLRRSPGFAWVTILVLALGVAASAVIFSLVHGLLWAPLKYHASDQLVQVRSTHPRSPISDLAPATFGALANGSAFSGLAAQYYYYVNLTGTDAPALFNSAEVTRGYFSLFGVEPLRGRLWTDDDATPGATPVVVLSYEVWQNHFHARDSIIGEQISLDEIPHTVIAVMPPSFRDPYETARIWRPMRPGADNLAARDWRYWTVFARLAPGASLADANAAVRGVAQQLATRWPVDYAEWSLEVQGLREVMMRNHRTGLMVLLAGVASLMAITIVNVAGLALVRATNRAGELAVRQALGASRWQVGRLLLAEAMLLALSGGFLGLILANWGVTLVIKLLPEGWLPRLAEIELCAHGIALGLFLALGAGAVIGLVTARGTLRPWRGDALKASQRAVVGAGSRRLRTGLVVAEIAITLMLLTGAGLLGRSLLGLIHRPSGMDGPRVLTATVSLSAKRYDSPEKSWAYFTRAEQAVAALPGVEAVGLTQTAPFRWGIPVQYRADRTGSQNEGELPPAFTDAVNVDFFRAVGVSLQRGRLFTADDDHRQPPMLILSQTAARRYFGEEDPIGRVLVTGPDSKFEVVGVVSDVRRAGLAAEMPLQVYRPMAQRTPAFATFMVRSSLSPTALAASVQAALRRIDPSTPITEVVPLADLITRSIAQPRLHAAIFGLFALAALALAATGLYGVIAYSVTQRSREFAVRHALGAQSNDVLGLVLTEGLRLIALGSGLGLAGALLVSGLVRHLVFDVALLDPFVFLFGPLTLAAVGLMACLIPARRAAKVDPMVALRAE